MRHWSSHPKSAAPFSTGLAPAIRRYAQTSSSCWPTANGPSGSSRGPRRSTAAPLVLSFEDEATSVAAGARVGPYRILREAGHGGMGTVYLAERDDEQYHKRVAVKLVRGGLALDDI